MQNHSRKYWITIVSKEHAERGISGGFIQVCHGKKAPLARMKSGDRFLIYSPKLRMEGTDKYQQFIAIGEILDDNIYAFQMTPDFCPYRRNVGFIPCQQTSIIPLIEQLSFIHDPKHWGYPFRFGILEIPEADFILISSKMGYYE